MATHIELPVSANGLQVVTLVDTPDADLIGQRKLSIGSHGYVQMYDRMVVLLHRWLLGLTTGDGLIGDHVNGDGLDNRRSNLRAVDPSGSSQNVKGRGGSRFRGVHPTGPGRWSARVKFQGVHHILGTFSDELEAARAAHVKRLELMPHYEPRAVDLALLYPADQSAA